MSVGTDFVLAVGMCTATASAYIDGPVSATRTPVPVMNGEMVTEADAQPEPLARLTADLLESIWQNHRPPQSWYDQNEEGLF